METNEDPEIVAALVRGNKIEAIKLYRARHPGTDLAEAKRQVERIERTLPPGAITARGGCSRTAALVIVALCAAIAWACN